MKTIAFVNRKGGVGKTSCVHHLGGALAKRGVRTLVVDVDPQASLSQGLLGPDEAIGLPPHETLAALYEDGCTTPPAELVMPVGRRNFALLPGHERMTDFNVPSPWDTGMAQFVLRDALATLSGDFDVCLIDCPPHVQFCAWSALVAADAVVVPAQVEDYGVQGIALILDSIDHARAVANPGLVLAGLLVSMYVKTLKIHQDYTTFLRDSYGDDVFENPVPAAKDFKEAVTMRKSLAEHKPRSAAAKAVELVADEMLARVAARCAVMPGALTVAVGERMGS